MDVANRTEKLAEIKKRKSEETSRLPYAGAQNPYPVHEIPLEYLIFNQYNGRIATFVKTHEKTNEEIDASTPEGDKLIHQFLWNSGIDRNKSTLKDIKEKGQIEAGVVTSDGIVVDGNRRFMLLKELDKEGGTHRFSAVILEENGSDNPKEMRRLEAICQKTDEKLEYNAIEKYLACDELKKHGYTEKQIAEFMVGETEAKIKRYLAILKLLEEYLDHCGIPGIYTQLEKEEVEGPIVDLHVGLNRRARDWEVKQSDLADFKIMMFDYIRAGFRTAHGLREISRAGGIFNNKSVWQNLLKKHEKIEEINDAEPSVDDLREEYPEYSTDEIITLRNDMWKSKAGGPKEGQRETLLNVNLRTSASMLERRKDVEKPYNLLSAALETLEDINLDMLRDRSKEDGKIQPACIAIREKINALVKIVSEETQ